MQMETFAPMMFAGLVLIMLIGFPVAFSLSALGLGSGFFAIYMFCDPDIFIEASGVRGSLNRLFVVGVHFELAL